MDYVETNTVEVMNNGKPSSGEFVDNRLHLLVDARQIETWELMVLEQAKISEWLLIFARYLARGEKMVSPELPNKPLDELTESEIAQIRQSPAYRALKHFKIQQLREAAKSFTEQATAGF